MARDAQGGRVMCTPHPLGNHAGSDRAGGPLLGMENRLWLLPTWPRQPFYPLFGRG